MHTIVSSKGQIVIPAKMRKALNLHSGQRINLDRRGRSIILSAEEPKFDSWLEERRRKGVLKEPLKVDRTASMPEAKKL